MNLPRLTSIPKPIRDRPARFQGDGTRLARDTSSCAKDSVVALPARGTGAAICFCETNPPNLEGKKWGYRSAMERVILGKICQGTVGSFFETNPPGVGFYDLEDGNEGVYERELVTE